MRIGPSGSVILNRFSIQRRGAGSGVTAAGPRSEYSVAQAAVFSRKAVSRSTQPEKLGRASIRSAKAATLG